MSGRPFDPGAHRVFWCTSCGEVLKTAKAAACHDHGLDPLSCTLSELGAWASGIVALLLWSQDGIALEVVPRQEDKLPLSSAGCYYAGSLPKVQQDARALAARWDAARERDKAPKAADLRGLAEYDAPRHSNGAAE